MESLPQSDSNEIIPKALSLMKERWGLDRFYMPRLYDPDRYSIPLFCARIKDAEKRIKSMAPQGTSCSLVPLVLAVPQLWEVPDLDRLLFHKSNRILAIRLPTGDLRDWVEPEISRLLYKRKYRLWFHSFEYAVLCYPEETILRLSRIKDGIFSFGYRSLCQEKILHVIKAMLQNNATVLLGSGIVHLDKIYYYEFDAYLEEARRYLGDLLFGRLMMSNRIR